MSFRDWLTPRPATANPAIRANGVAAQDDALAALATLAVATPAQPQPKRGPAELDLAPGWQRREAAAHWGIEAGAVEQQWREYLNRYPGSWTPPEPYETKCRLNEYVAAFNRLASGYLSSTCTDPREAGYLDPRAVIAALAPGDYADPYKVNRGALMALVHATADTEKSHAQDPEAQEERAAIYEFDAGLPRAEAERRTAIRRRPGEPESDCH